MKAIEYLEFLAKRKGKVGFSIAVDDGVIEYKDVIAELKQVKSVIEIACDLLDNYLNGMESDGHEVIQVFDLLQNIKSLKDWVKVQKGVAKKTFDEEEYSQLNDRTYTIFETILQKLEELEQYHIKDKQCLS